MRNAVVVIRIGCDRSSYAGSVEDQNIRFAIDYHVKWSSLIVDAIRTSLRCCIAVASSIS